MVIPEASVDIQLNERLVGSIVCRPENPEEPALGRLFSHRILASMEAIKAVRVHPHEKIVSIQALVDEDALEEKLPLHDREIGLEKRRPETGQRPPWRSLLDDKVSAAFCSLAERFHEILEVKGIFGAYHVAALGDRKGKLVCQAGDVGMDVTVDRVLGKALLGGIQVKGLPLLISGRLNVGMVRLIAGLGIPTIMTSSVVTQLALETALALGVEIIHNNGKGGITIFGPCTAEGNAADDAQSPPGVEESGFGA